jgi:hypothetical protein
LEIEAGFTPEEGDRFRLVESRQRTGRFRTVEVPQGSTNRAFQVAYTPGGAVLEVVAPPTLVVKGPALFDPQTGISRQSIQLRNPGTNTIYTVRLMLGELPAQLVTVTGVENRRRFVQLNEGLGAGEAQTVVLEFRGQTSGLTPRVTGRF